jgi:hypothetical protein
MRYITDEDYLYLQATVLEVMKDEDNVIHYNRGLGMVFVLDRLDQVPHDDSIRDFLDGDDDAEGLPPRK